MNNYKLTKQLIDTSNVIRQKYKALKRNKNSEEIELERTFKPLLKPIRKIEKNTKSVNMIKDEKPDFIGSFQNDFEGFSNNENENKDDSNKNESVDDNKSEKESVDDDDDAEVMASTFFALVANRNKEIDTTYGVYFDSAKNEYKIGNASLKVIGNNFIVNDNQYSATQGLYQLLFLKAPNKNIYTQDDLANYKNILIISSAHKLNFDVNSRTKGGNGNKYKNIIKPLINQHDGAGFMELPKNKIDYVYWDDANEMVNRLRLLLASQQSGHSNHNNEIMSILEELREADIIV